MHQTKDWLKPWRLVMNNSWNLTEGYWWMYRRYWTIEKTGNGRGRQQSNYHQLKRVCRERNLLFEDPDFPACSRSLFTHKKPHLAPLTWQRPHVRPFKIPQDSLTFINIYQHLSTFINIYQHLSRFHQIKISPALGSVPLPITFRCDSQKLHFTSLHVSISTIFSTFWLGCFWRLFTIVWNI